MKRATLARFSALNIGVTLMNRKMADLMQRAIDELRTLSDSPTDTQGVLIDELTIAILDINNHLRTKRAVERKRQQLNANKPMK
jgi:hypothetical protein